MGTLYEISEQYLELIACIENEDIPREAITDTLAGIEGDFNAKAENVACYIKSLKSQADAIKAEEKALAERRKAKENNLTKLKLSLMDCMKQLDIKKIDTPRARIIYSEVKNKSLDIVNEDEIPEKYMVQQSPKIDRISLLAAIKSGLSVPGVTLKNGESVAIK